MKMEKTFKWSNFMKMNLVLCFQWFGAAFLYTKQSHIKLVVESSRIVDFEGIDWNKSDTIEVIVLFDAIYHLRRVVY